MQLSQSLSDCCLTGHQLCHPDCGHAVIPIQRFPVHFLKKPLKPCSIGMHESGIKLILRGMGNTLSQGIEIPVVITGAAVLLSFGVAVVVSVLSAWIPVRRASRLPIKNVVLGVAEETQVSNRFIVGIGIVLFLISEILPKVVTGNMLYIAGGFSLLGLIIATIFIVAGPKISMLPELDFMTFLSAGAMGVLVTLTGSVVPIVKSKKMKLVEEIKFE